MWFIPHYQEPTRKATGEYLISLVRPLYVKIPIPNIDIKNEIFALDSTTISLSITLFIWDNENILVVL